MTTYRTGNAVGSADPRDLYDNSENLDELVNSQDKLSHPDRLGVSRKTWHGMEQEFQAAQADKQQRFNALLAASGYVFVGDYAAGITVSEYNEVIRDTAGNLWRAASTTELPYTTDGTGMPEGGAFVSAGDAVLRNDLMGEPVNGQGALLVRGSVIYVDTIADLQALPTSELVDGQQVQVKEYHAGTGVGGGAFHWDATSTDSANVVNVFVADSSASGRFLRTNREFITPEQAGFFGSLDPTESLQNCLNYLSLRGQGRLVLDGLYEIDRPLSVTKEVFNTHESVIIEGSGTIKKSASFVGDRLLTLNLSYHDEDNVIFRGITFDGVDKSINLVDWWDESEPYDSEPLDMSNTDYAKAVRFDNVNFNNGYRGVRLSGNSNRFVSCTFRGNACGMFSTAAANDMSFVGCNFRRGGVGVHIKTSSPALGTVNTNFTNCIFESNTITGVALQNDPSDVSLVGCYWENNGFSLTNPSYTMSTMPTDPAHIFDFGGAFGNGRKTIIGGHFWSSPSGVKDVLSPNNLRKLNVTSSRMVSGIKASGDLIDIHFAAPDYSLSRIDFSDVTSVRGLIIGGTEYYRRGDGEILPLPDGDTRDVGPGITSILVESPASYGMYEVTVNAGPNNSAVFIANKWRDEVKDIVRFGISTGQPECFFEDGSLKVTAGTGSTNRVTVRRLTKE